MIAAITFALRSAKGESMTDTDPQREGETLQREYPDPSVLGGGRPLDGELGSQPHASPSG